MLIAQHFKQLTLTLFTRPCFRLVRKRAPNVYDARSVPWIPRNFDAKHSLYRLHDLPLIEVLPRVIPGFVAVRFRRRLRHFPAHLAGFE